MKNTQQNARVKRTYKNGKKDQCKPGALCYPQSWFGMIEKCKECNKKL